MHFGFPFGRRTAGVAYPAGTRQGNMRSARIREAASPDPLELACQLRSNEDASHEPQHTVEHQPGGELTVTKMMTGVMTFGLFLRSRRQFSTQSVCVARASLGMEPRPLHY